MISRITLLTAVTVLALGTPRAVAAQSQADSIYRAARSQLNSQEFRRASEGFRELRRRYPDSQHTPDSYYWEAFALQRSGDLRGALSLLQTQRSEHPDASTAGDALQLETRICGELAQRGDAQCAAAVSSTARQGTDDATRMAALNALINMSSERAMPILRRLLENPNTSAEVRRQAVFLVADKAEGAEATEILLNLARNDRDVEVRQQAIFWLSEVDGEASVDALIEILNATQEPEIADQAIFALSQQGGTRAMQTLRQVATDPNRRMNARKTAIFWLGNEGGDEGVRYLRELYPQVNEREIKEQIIFAIADSDTPEARTWLMERANDPRENIEVRKNAIFWAGEAGVPLRDLISLYDNTREAEIRQQLIFVFSQSDETAAIDKLMDIAQRDPSPEARRDAIFWLGESDDPRAADLLLRLIEQ